MITLAFDTALDKMYVVLRRNGLIIASETVETTQNRYHSADLMPTIKRVLKNNNLTLQNVDLIATNIGPGSFTGIRACTTAARVMAQQLSCCAIGVSSLEILSRLNPTAQPSLVALDARKGCAYVWRNSAVEGAAPVEQINTDGYFVITDDTLQPVLGGISYQSAPYPLGEIMAQIAEKRVESECGDWRELKPLYIQPPSIHTKVR